MDRFDFMKRLQDRTKEVEEECSEVKKEIEYHEARSAKSLGIVTDGDDGGALWSCKTDRVITFNSAVGGPSVWATPDGDSVDAVPPTDEVLEMLSLTLANAKQRLEGLKADLAKAKSENIVDKIKDLINE